MVMVNMAAREAERFSPRTQEGSVMAKWAYGVVGFPSSRDFKNMLCITTIYNLPVALDAVMIAKNIYGPNIHSLKGKTLRRQPTPVVKDYITVPPEVLK